MLRLESDVQITWQFGGEGQQRNGHYNQANGREDKAHPPGTNPNATSRRDSRSN